ncbi:MAG: cation-translocating P-type ATPase C-terminal domain-containing protein [Spirochaetota bacterium]
MKEADSGAAMRLLSNKVMLLWASGVIGLLVLATSIPLLHSSLKLTDLSSIQWLFVIGVSFLTTFWMEAEKLIFEQTKDQQFNH